MNYRALMRAVDRAVAGSVRDALRKHGNVRDAAKAINMPKSTLHDFAVRCGFTTRPRKKARS